MIGSVQRAIDLLLCFSIEQPELSVTELSARLRVHKSTVSRLLTTLAEARLVERDPGSGKYRLGSGLLELAGLVSVYTDLRQIARPFLRQLSDSTQETVNLAVLEHNQSFNIEQAVSYGRRVSGMGWVGRKTPLHASSTGKTLLAFLPQEQLEALLQAPLERFTENTIIEPQALRQELQQIRTLGYATGLEELEMGLNAIAAPVRDYTGAVVAAVSVSGPSPRLTEANLKAEVAPRLLECARKISQALGYPIAN